MNRMLHMGVLAISVSGLAACASTQHTVSQPSPPAARPGSISNDSAYIARVEQIARRRGIQVTWVNPPGKRVADR